MHLTSGEGLLSNHTFVAGDRVRTFNNALTLRTAGSRTLTATDTTAGTSGNITVAA